MKDIDECVANPCQNGGSCTDRVNGHICSCIDGYNGPNCENGENKTFVLVHIKSNIWMSWRKTNIEQNTYLITYILKHFLQILMIAQQALAKTVEAALIK